VYFLFSQFLRILDAEDINLDISNDQPLQGQPVIFTCNTRDQLGINNYVFYRNDLKQHNAGTSPVYQHSINDNGVWYCEGTNANGTLKLTSKRINIKARGLY